MCAFFLIFIANPAHSESTIIDSALVEHLQEISEKNTQQSQATTKISALNTQFSQPIPVNVPIIVTLTDVKYKDKVLNFLNQNNAKIKYNYELIDAIALDISYENIQRLASSDYIKGIYLDKKVQIPEPDERFEQEMQELRKKGKFTPLLSESTKAIGAQFVWDNDIDGTGVKIAVLDTGIDKNHPGLKDKVVLERDFTLFDNKLDSSDGYGHGTHCAGIIAGDGAGSTILVDTTSTDTSGLTNIPNPEITPHVGMVELDDVYNVLLTKWIFKITPTSNVSYDDIPYRWWGYDTDNYVFMVQENENYTLEINRDETQIYDISIDGGKSWMTGTGTQDWGNVTIGFSTGINGYVEITSDYGLIYLDEDGDFNTMIDQMKAFENEHFNKYYSVCPYWGECYGFWDSTEYIVSQIDSEGNNLTIGLDINWDYQYDTFKGVAPGAQLLNGKVLSDDGYGYDSGIIAGIEWAVLNGADVISMSLGGWENICDGNDPLAQATEKAWDMGTVVAISAGNSGWLGNETIGSPGCAKKVITVGASSKYAQSEYIAYFSSIGPTADGRIKPEVVAPGVSIISARSSNANMGLVYIPHYTSASGTSMAAPHVAGAVALLKQTNPNLTPDEIKEILMNTAEDFGERIFVQGAGLINVSNAHELANESKILATPPLLNLIVQNGVQTTISLNTALNNPTLSAIKDDAQIVDTVIDYDVVNPATGFNYTFYIPNDVYSFNISINWDDSSNDIDMSLYNPVNMPYSGSYGISNSETVFVYKPEEGLWRMYVYPYYVSEEVNVTITLRTYKPEKWDWFTYSGNELTIIPDVDISGLYSGKIKLNSSDEDVMIPASIIVSEPIEFKSYATHNDFGTNICGEGIYTYPIQTAEEEAEPEPTTGGSNRIASFDGYFCSSNERRAFSFEVPALIPYMDVFLWVRYYNPESFNDMRLFVYDPTGKEYDVSDSDGSMERSYIHKPLEGNWTLVIESENLYLPDEAGLQFSGEIWYPGMTINPRGFSMTLEPDETFNVTINITNFLDSDFFLRPIESNVWVETPLDIIPNSDIDKNNTLGPFSYSYRYYNFNVTEEQLNNNKLLKFEAHLDSLTYLSTFELYIFDGNGTLVEQARNYYGSDIYEYIYLTEYYKSGLWTIVLVGEGLYYKEYPFDLNIWVMNKAECDWISVIDKPTDYFTYTEDISLSIKLPDNATSEYYYTTLYLNGDWYSGESHQVLEGSWSDTIPLSIYLVRPMINISLDIDKQEYRPTEEVIASAQLTNTEEYMYKQTTGTVFWQITYRGNTTIISEIDNVQIFGGESVDLAQKWRANILEPGDYILTLVYNYTDYYGKNWVAELSKQFNVALVSVSIPTDGSINITEGELTLQIKVGDSTNAAVNLIKHLTNPGDTTPSGMTDWSKFVQIEVNDDLEGNLNWAIITMHYNDSEVSAAGIDENSLKMYYLNETLNEWTACENTGVNVIANYVWANVTHFSHYGSFGSIPSQEPPPEEENKDLGGGGSSSGGSPSTIQTITCTEDWTCTEWSSCENNKQIRTCTDQNDCGTEKNKPTESQICEIEDETPEEVLTQDISDTKEEEEVITPTESITQGDVGPTGLATAGVSKDARNLGIILIVVIVISFGVFLSRKKNNVEPIKYKKHVPKNKKQ